MQQRFSLGHKIGTAYNYLLSFGITWHDEGDCSVYQPAPPFGPYVGEYNGTDPGAIGTTTLPAGIVYGKYYRVTIYLSNTDANALMRVAFGLYQPPAFVTYCTDSVITFDAYYMGGTKPVDGFECDIRLNFESPSGVPCLVTVTAVEAIELNWNDPLNDQPNAKTKLVIKKSDLYKSTYVSYMENVIFWGDGKAYLENILNQNYLNAALCRVEINSNGVWYDHYSGPIFLNECQWKANEVICTIEDEASATIIRKNLDTRIDDSPELNDIRDLVALHDNTGVHYADGSEICNFGKHIKYLCAMVSDMNCGADFGDILTNATRFLYLGFCTGVNINKVNATADIYHGVNISLNEVLKALNQVFPIGMIGKIHANGMPYLYLDALDELQDATGLPLITFNNVNNEPLTFELDNHFKSIKTGFIVNSLTSEKEGTSNFTTNDRSAQGTLDISTNFIQTSDIIFDMFDDVAPDANKFRDYFMFVLYEKNPNYQSVIEPITFNYNYNLTEDYNFSRWLNVLNNTFRKEGTSYFFPSTSKGLYKIYSFDTPLKLSELQTIRSNPLKHMAITGKFNSNECYLEELEYDNELQLAKIKVIAT